MSAPEVPADEADLTGAAEPRSRMGVNCVPGICPRPLRRHSLLTRNAGHPTPGMRKRPRPRLPWGGQRGRGHGVRPQEAGSQAGQGGLGSGYWSGVSGLPR